MMPLATSWRATRRTPKGVPRLLVAVCLTGFLLGPARLSAADPREATTSDEARREAVAAMPLARMTEADRAAVSYVLEDTSLYRRMPTSVIECDPRLFSFLLDNPTILTNVWELMKISDVRLTRTSPTTYHADDGRGTQADIKVVYRSHDTQVLYCEGAYTGTLPPRSIHGRCVLLLRSRGIQETNGRYYVTCRLDTFLHLDRVGVELIAKAFHPLLGRAADANFTETLAFVGHLSRTCLANPDGAARMAMRLTRVEPAVRRQFGAIVHQAAEGAAGTPSMARRERGRVGEGGSSTRR
jgi:hypothetical protein